MCRSAGPHENFRAEGFDMVFVVSVTVVVGIAVVDCSDVLGLDEVSAMEDARDDIEV